jgi:hypothetical protein
MLIARDWTVGAVHPRFRNAETAKNGDQNYRDEQSKAQTHEEHCAKKIANAKGITTQRHTRKASLRTHGTHQDAHRIAIRAETTQRSQQLPL